MNYIEACTNFLVGIPIIHKDFVLVDFPTGWTELGDPNFRGDKIIAANTELGVVLKAYAPQYQKYVDSVRAFYEELTGWNFTTQPLLPLAVINSSFIFPLGNNIERRPYGAVFNDVEQATLAYTLAKYGLTELNPQRLVDIVSVDGSPFVLDIFEDCVLELVQFEK